MINQILGKNSRSSYLETSLRIEEIVVAYPDNPLENPGEIFIARVNFITTEFKYVDIKLIGNSYEMSKYNEIDPKLKDFVDWRIAGKPKNMGGIGGNCVLTRYPGESIIITYRNNNDPILELNLLPTKLVKKTKFGLWGDDLKFLREELSSEDSLEYKLKMDEEK